MSPILMRDSKTISNYEMARTMPNHRIINGGFHLLSKYYKVSSVETTK